MIGLWTLYKKELRAFLNSPIVYAFGAAYLGILLGLFFYATGFLMDKGEASLRGFFNFVPWANIVFLPILTMRLLAEEKALGTIEVLLTFPVRVWQVVFSKYLACLTCAALTFVPTLALVATVQAYGDPDPGPLWGAYVGALLLTAAQTAIGCFASSLCRNQIVAAILAILACLFLHLIGYTGLTASVTGPVGTFLTYLGFLTHVDPMFRGVIDVRDVAYFLSLTLMFLSLTWIAMAERE